MGRRKKHAVGFYFTSNQKGEGSFVMLNFPRLIVRSETPQNL